MPTAISPSGGVAPAASVYVLYLEMLCKVLDPKERVYRIESLPLDEAIVLAAGPLRRTALRCAMHTEVTCSRTGAGSSAAGRLQGSS
jgi:hypothetical protein